MNNVETACAPCMHARRGQAHKNTQTEMDNTYENKAGLKRENFRKEIDGKHTDLYILRNSLGTEVAVTNFGAVMPAIMLPDRNGTYGNILLGHDSIDNIINSPEPFLCSTIGRYGNRIARGRFTLEGKEYHLNINNGPNSLHGGPEGFHRAVWDAEQTDDSTLRLHHTSPGGDEGFPGDLYVTMTYHLTEDNELVITYKAETDKATIVNLTNHAFFNLTGIGNPSQPVTDYELTINADFYIPIDEVSIPTGEILSVKGTPFDFTTPHKVGERIDDKHQQTINGAGYDHCFVLNKREPGELSFAARCTDPASGRTLEVYTTEPGMQLYTGNWLNGFAGAHGATFPARSAICFETQHFPDTPNRPYFPPCVLHPGETYTQTCIYKFGIKGQE